MTQNVKVIDKGWNKIQEQLRKYATGKTASVGIQSGKAGEDHGGLTNAELGAIHEFGTQDGKIPERSFVRSTYGENEDQITRNLAKLAKNKVFSGEDPIQELTMIGEEFRTKVLEKIKSGITPPLAQSTVNRKKGEPTPLIDTGQLWNAITSEIVDPRSKER